MIDANKPCWFAAYTKPRSEKITAKRLLEAGIEVYLPLQKRLRSWSDRKKLVEEPVIRSYIFVRITAAEYYKVLQDWGVVRYVCFEGKAVPIPDIQIDLLKRVMGEGLEVEGVEEALEPGTWVEVCSGALMGYQGEMVKHQGKSKVVIRLKHISHMLLVTLPKSYVLKKIKEQVDDSTIQKQKTPKQG